MKRQEAYPSNYLGQEDVDPPRIFTIKTVTRELVTGDDGEKLKTIMSFRDCNQQFILNGTNWDICAEIFASDDSDDWVGRQLELFRDPTIKFGTKLTGGTRVRLPGGVNPPAAMLPPELLSWDEAVALCAEVRIGPEELKTYLVSRGNAGWKGDRDTPIVKAMVAQKRERPGERVVTDEVPF